MPAALGGAWTTRAVCDSCQTRANEVADKLITQDFLVLFLRSVYGIQDRRNVVPPPPRFTVPLDDGGVVLVTLDSDGTQLQGATSPEVAALLGLSGESASDEARLRELVGEDVRTKLDDPRELARQVQKRTPPPAWSRFIAKLALACGRKAYGDAWMDGPHARLLSADLLACGAPKLSQQREHYPPVGDAWPFQPPKHVLWIDDVEDAALLHVVLFGQVLGAVAINNAGSASEYSAWRFDPTTRDFGHTTYPAIWYGTAAARASETGRRSLTILDGEHSFFYVEDGPDGPMEMPVPTRRADSPADALSIVAAHKRGPAPAISDAACRRQTPKVGRNDPCPCRSGKKYKRCCGA